MRANAIAASHTRIIPASKANKVVEISRGADGAMNMKFGDGRTGTLDPDDKEIQEFVVWTMLNPECTK